ncbi:MAG: class I SAM-dependent methyltransferase [Acidimicrobiales bacterium]|nr:class I SAM-dependent methyltransferase [Acidimicrobiales bacterium]
MTDGSSPGRPSPAPPQAAAVWNGRYDVEHYVFGTEPNDFLRAGVDRLRPSRVLCLAEGEGRNAVFLAGQGFEVSAVDLSEVGVRKTHDLAASRGVTVRATAADLGSFDLGDGQWDSIVSIFAHLPPSVRSVVHRRVVDALVPGGVLLLEAYTPAQIGRGTGGPPVPELTMTVEALRRELEGLEFEHAAELEREVIEGAGHSGMASVVQVIARRPG